ncbi:acylphosphatase [Rhodovulum sulfidophilum]|uniref:acylphosphatase n=1 Tax=Rhodovulum sulfidophilum TaxID=35806 RepID=UPI001920469F|nr:acylphosphatase [Rhodovulum sulfidophilum]MBL3575273.1 acylphosphatase [Rhodovulum sulfidophilum]MCE8432435.1 acylphosphatase [Rhodovulum sulfidophilum]MCF4116439.1 acylphosphatase [Rhodovulum sulfidophilum]
MTDRIAIRVRIAGRVQGVGFRAWTEAQAAALGLSGWVRNEADGAVLALLAGPEDRVAQMLDVLQEGPAPARVETVETTPGDWPAEAGFRISR